MEKTDVTQALSALAHDGRLDVFRLLVQAGAEGLAAGKIAERLEMRPNTLSNNLGILTTAGLIRATREGRSIRYFVEWRGIRGLLGYLVEDCCGGKPDLCKPVWGAIGPQTTQAAPSNQPNT